MKKSELRQLIKEEIQNFQNNSSELDINDLFYNFKNSEDMTMAGIIDSYLIDNKFGGDIDMFEEEDGYSMRDSIIRELSSGLQNKLETLLSDI
jgi:hypothetical protein